MSKFKNNQQKSKQSSKPKTFNAKQSEISSIDEQEYVQSLNEIFSKNCKTLCNARTFDEVKILHVNSAVQFYACRISDWPALQRLQKDLKVIFDDSEPDEFQFRLGDMCAVCVYGDWFRGRVKVISKQLKEMSVFLVDFGYSVNATFANVRILMPHFVSFGPLAFQCIIENAPFYICSLTDDEADVKKRLVAIAKSRCRIQVFYESDVAPVVVKLLVSGYDSLNAFVIDKSLAAFDVEKLIPNSNTWLSMPSDISVLSSSDRSWMGKKIKVDYAHAISPMEIYVRRTNSSEKLRQMHQTIQRIALEIEVDEDLEWIEGNDCLVQTILNGASYSMWYRGIIISTEYFKEGMELVFLRDYGQIVQVDRMKLKPLLDKELAKIEDCVVKCHLYGVRSWPRMTRAELNLELDQLELGENYVSFGQCDANQSSIPIILWHPKMRLSDGVIVSWIDINRKFVTSTLKSAMDQTISNRNKLMMPMKSISLGIDEYTERLAKVSLDAMLDDSDDDDFIDESEFLSEPIIYELGETNDVDVDEWLPSEPIEKVLFAGTPCFVTPNLEFYLLDSYRAYLAHSISRKIRKIVRENKCDVNPFGMNWQIGHACFARYNCDGEFYRGKIVRMNEIKQMCCVNFIDYGNSAWVKFEHLHRATAFAHIPCLARKYCLENVVPVSRTGKWSTIAIRIAESFILNEICAIRVADFENTINEIVSCQIQPGDQTTDLASFLVMKELCRYK